MKIVDVYVYAFQLFKNRVQYSKRKVCMNKEMKCFGCGAIIQSENEKHIGYVPKVPSIKIKFYVKDVFN